MNKIQFLEKAHFPLSATRMNDLQAIIESLQNVIVAVAGNNNCILKGVVNTTGTYSAGIVIINGETLPFIQSSGNYLQVVEETDTVTAFGEIYNVLKRRYARAVVQNTSVSMSNLEVINLSRFREVFTESLATKASTTALDNLATTVATKAAIPKYNGGHNVLNTNSAYTNYDMARLMWEQTESGFSVIKGRLSLKPNTYSSAGWYTMFSIAGYSALMPRTPHGDTATYFNVYYDDYETGSFNVKIGRITASGDFQLYFPAAITLSANKYVYINISYYNPMT